MGASLADLLRRIGLALGLIAQVSTVALSPLVVEADGGSLRVSTRLENGITQEVEELVRRSTEVSIVYLVDLYTSTDLRYHYRVVHQIRHRGLSEDYRVLTEAGEEIVPLYGTSIERLCSFTFVTDVEDARLLVVRARLEIPDIGDDDLVASLWRHVDPRASCTFRSEP
jgi:hypothetical protein